MAIVQLGLQGYSGGAIADQTLLLQEIQNGLGVYNGAVDPYIEMYTQMTQRENVRVSQAPKKFGKSADGGTPTNQRMLYRILATPLDDYDLSTEFTVKWLQDALSSDVVNEVNGAMLGDVQLLNSLFWQTVLTKRTPGSAGSAAYQASFWNGETDVPRWKTNNFTAAHYHYLGLNATTFTQAHFDAMKLDIQEHGFGLNAGGLTLYHHSAQTADIQALFNSNSTILQAPTPQRTIAIDQGIRETRVTLNGVVIQCTDDIPAGYLAMLANDEPPLLKRVHFNNAYTGLQMFSNHPVPDYPLAGMQFLRRVGFSVRLLSAGTCRQLVGSTTYTNPTFPEG